MMSSWTGRSTVERPAPSVDWAIWTMARSARCSACLARHRTRFDRRCGIGASMIDRFGQRRDSMLETGSEVAALLARFEAQPLDELTAEAEARTLRAHGPIVNYSRKV